MNTPKKTVFVGISGGVDSSVAALLLKQRGYDVQGIFVKTWSPEWLPCTWLEEKRDAMRLCAALNIPFHFLDASQEYQQGVAEYMISEYKAGRTPNPDVLCNKVIKFGVMWQYAKAHGAASIATGHYARIEDDVLKKGSDPAKDQAYFLWMIEQSLLKYIEFPIGHLQKDEVRQIAKKAKLFTATKKDSQGICFLGDINMKEFLLHYIDEQPGTVINEEGKIIGEHDGVWFYTLGERHGFRITEKDTNRVPYYIVEKDIKQNTLIVSTSSKNTTQNSTVNVVLRDTNWIDTINKDDAYTAQIRYHGKSLDAKLIDEKTVTLSTDEAIPLGQSLVLYSGDRLIGGGVIDKLY